jgi:hypothetical protein
MDDKKLWCCRQCGVSTKTDQLLKAKNPFNIEDEIVGCPSCKTIDDFYEVCDEQFCTSEASCGFPDEFGVYRRTCFKHSIFAKKATPEEKMGVK